jgi:hypothetical protein
MIFSASGWTHSIWTIFNKYGKKKWWTTTHCKWYYI